MAEPDLKYAGDLYTHIGRLARGKRVAGPDTGCIIHNPHAARVVAAYESISDEDLPTCGEPPGYANFYDKDFIGSTYNVVAESDYCGSLLSLCQSGPSWVVEPAARAAIVRRLTALAAEHSAAVWWAPRLTARLIQILSP